MAVGRRWSWKGELPGRGGASSKSDVDKRRRSGAKVKPERRQQRSGGNVGAENEGGRCCERAVWEMGGRRRRKSLCSTKRWELMGGDANVWRVCGREPALFHEDARFSMAARSLACQTATDKARAFSLTIGDEEQMTSALQQITTPVRLGERVASSVDLPATGPHTHADRPSSEVDATYVGRYGIQSASAHRPRPCGWSRRQSSTNKNNSRLSAVYGYT